MIFKRELVYDSKSLFVFVIRNIILYVLFITKSMCNLINTLKIT